MQNTHMELVASKRNVWQGLQQQEPRKRSSLSVVEVSLVLMTLEFQPFGLPNGHKEPSFGRFPALSEENFMQILHLT